MYLTDNGLYGLIVFIREQIILLCVVNLCGSRIMTYGSAIYNHVR